MGWSAAMVAQPDLPVSLRARQTPLVEVLQELENRYDLRFSYSNDLLAGIVVSARVKRQALGPILEQLLAGQNLDFRFVQDRYVLIVPAERGSITSTSPAPPPPTTPARRRYTLRGTVLDAETQEPLPFANIRIVPAGTGGNSDVAGVFDLKLAALPADSVEVSYLGYEAQRFALEEVVGEPQVIALRMAAFGLANVVVTAYLTDAIQSGDEVGQIQFSPARMEVLPGQAEPDILQGVLLLPGISSPSESVSDLNIRGGTTDQNLVLWDGIPIYHTGHYFGSITAFNPYVVDKVQVWRGGYGAEYGGRVAGVIDIQSRHEIPAKWHAGAGLNLTHGHVYWELPFAKQKAAWFFSARRAFTDILPTITFNNYQQKVFQGTKVDEDQRPLDDPLQVVTDRFFFNDLHSKLLWQPSEKDEFSASFFSGRNFLEFGLGEPSYQVEDLLDIDNWGALASWRHTWSDRWRWELRASHSSFDYTSTYRETFNALTLEDTDKLNTLRDSRLRTSLQWRPNPRHQLLAGLEWVDYAFSFAIDFTSIYEERFEESVDNEAAVSIGFLNYTFRDADQKWKVQLGVRSASLPKLEDRYLEPRLGITHQVAPAWRLKGSLGLNHQYVSQLIELGFNGLGVNNQIWGLVDGEDISVLRSWQSMLGFDWKHKGWYLDVEGYSRHLSGLTSFARAFGPLQADEYSRGTGRTFGVDVLLRKRWKHQHSWISYTLSRSQYLFEDLAPDWIPAFNDQRHQFSWVYLWQRKPFDLSVGWYVSSGKPFTPLESVELVEIEDDDEMITVATPTLGELNSRYLPTYHRLDVSAVYTLPKKKARSPKQQIGLSIINVYNRDNVVDRRFQEDYFEDEEDVQAQVDLLEINLLPFTPNLFFRIAW
jgi:hypothetical protein